MNDLRPPPEAPLSLDSIRLMMVVDTAKAVAKFHEFMIMSNLTRAEYRVKAHGNDVGSLLIGCYLNELEKVGIKVEFYSVYPLGQTPDGVVVREVSLLLKREETRIIS